MKVLLLSPASVRPPRHGAGVRLDRLARHLAGSHEVTMVTFDGRPGAGPRPPYELIELDWAPPPRGPMGRWFRRFGLVGQVAASAENRLVLRRILDCGEFDVVAGQYLSLATLLPEITDVPIVWSADGIQSRLARPSGEEPRSVLRRLQDWLVWHRIRSLEEWAWGRADVLVAVSEEEASELRDRLDPGARVVVAPNGADCEAYSTVNPRLGAPRGLFLGGTWPPNVDALNWFAREVLPEVLRRRPDFRLDVAGRVGESRDLTPNLPPEIRLRGWVDDLREVFAGCGLFIAPIRRGHGTRLKILDAMAAGLPVVSTGIGAQGLGLRDGDEILLADDATKIAEATVRLVEDPDLAARIATAGRRVAQERFDWRVVSAQFEEALTWAARSARNPGAGPNPLASMTGDATETGRWERESR